MLKLIVVRNIREFFSPSAKKVYLHYDFLNTKFGQVLVGVIEHFVCCLAFVLQHSDMECEALRIIRSYGYLNNNFIIERDADHVAKLVGSVFTENYSDADITILVQGTEFQEKVWKTLMKIPPGKTMFYSEVAALAGCPSAIRACASAIGANRVAFFIPCHRVVSKTGKVSKYGFGPAIKNALLHWESKFGSQTI